MSGQQQGCSFRGADVIVRKARPFMARHVHVEVMVTPVDDGRRAHVLHDKQDSQTKSRES